MPRLALEPCPWCQWASSYSNPSLVQLLQESHHMFLSLSPKLVKSQWGCILPSRTTVPTIQGLRDWMSSLAVLLAVRTFSSCVLTFIWLEFRSDKVSYWWLKQKTEILKLLQRHLNSWLLVQIWQIHEFWPRSTYQKWNADSDSQGMLFP